MRGNGVKVKETKLNQIAVRLDDITPDMNWENFYKFKEILDKHNIKPLMGVVPDNKDKSIGINPKREDFFPYMKELESKGWVIAQHGYQHSYKNHNGGIFPLNLDSEFTGESFQTQMDCIEKGKHILESEGINPIVYMAPSHSYDKITIKVLKQLGFRYITDGFGTTPYERGGICFLPIAFSCNNALTKKHGITTLVFHTNTMTDKDRERWEQQFTKHQEKLINFNELLKYPAKERNFFGNMIEYIMARSKFYLVRLLSRVKR